jgi:hypothetical protein
MAFTISCMPPTPFEITARMPTFLASRDSCSFSSFLLNAFVRRVNLRICIRNVNIWQIRQTEPKDFAMDLIGFGKRNGDKS